LTFARHKITDSFLWSYVYFLSLYRQPHFGTPSAKDKGGGNASKFCLTSTHGRKKLMMELLKRLWQEEEGQDLTEYALLLVLIALAAIAVMGSLGNQINAVFSSAASTLNSATTAANS
jgi:pilus assembly protein Flp/PilA